MTRGLLLWCSMALLLAVPSGAQGEDVGALKSELESVRREFEVMRQQYEGKLRALGRRIDELEARPGQPGPAAPSSGTRAAGAPSVATPSAGTSAAGAPSAATPAAVSPSGGTPAAGAPSAATPGPVSPSAAAPSPTVPVVTATAAAGSESPTLLDLARPRQPFALASPGRALLFDMGVSGDFVADFTSVAHERRGDGTFAGRENRFFPREVSLGFFGRIDPYASAVVKLSAGQEPPSPGSSGTEFTVKLDEANVTVLAIPFVTPRFGLMRPRFGTLNVVHQDDLPQVDRPDVLRQFFGEEQIDGEAGLDAMAVLPLPFYQEVSLGVFNGDNETAFGLGRIRNPLIVARLRSFFELDEWGGLQIDLSVATGPTADDHRNTVAGLGVKYKWAPAVGYAFPVVTLAGELIFGTRTVLDADGVTERRLDRFGYYVYGQYDWSPRWAVGLRYDWTEQPTSRGREWAVSPYLQFKPSEFLRFRVQYKHTGDAGGGSRDADEVFLQGSFILGAHPTERF